MTPPVCVHPRAFHSAQRHPSQASGRRPSPPAALLCARRLGAPAHQRSGRPRSCALGARLPSRGAMGGRSRRQGLGSAVRAAAKAPVPHPRGGASTKQAADDLDHERTVRVPRCSLLHPMRAVGESARLQRRQVARWNSALDLPIRHPGEGIAPVRPHKIYSFAGAVE